MTALFKIGQEYTRRQIHEQIGGGLIACFLLSKGSVVGVCVRQDMNPGAPEVVLVGFGRQKERAAEILGSEKFSVPLFMKSASNRWRFSGMYAGTKCSSDPSDIASISAGFRQGDVSKILWLKRD